MSGTGDMLSMVRRGMTPILAPAASFAVVVVLVVFILLERNHLRDRFLRIGVSFLERASGLGSSDHNRGELIRLLTESRLFEAKAMVHESSAQTAG